MFIHEMTEIECREALRDADVARLACSNNNQPYIVPISFVLDREYIYSFATDGQKIEWMRANPSVCIEVDRRDAYDRWHSVIVFGHYEELPDLLEFEAARSHAYSLLSESVTWWEPAAVGVSHRDSAHSMVPIVYRIRIEHMTGHRASPDTIQLEKPHPHHWWSRP